MFQPTGYRVLIRVPKVATQTAGGIVLPPQTRDREQSEAEVGEVVAIGPTYDEAKLGSAPKIGDRILFAKFAGKFVPGTEKEYLLINDEDVIGIAD